MSMYAKICSRCLPKRFLEVSKSQKNIFLKLQCPKNERTKFCPMKLGQKFVKYFGFFFYAMEFQEKMLLRFTDL